MTQKNPRRIIQLLAVPLAIFIGVSAVFLLAEGVLRIAGIPRQAAVRREIPQNDGLTIFRPDRELGWAYVPNLAVRMQFGPPRWVDVFFDKNGIRIPSDHYYLNPAKPSILFVGCSFTMGHALFYEETVAGRIAALPQFPLQVVNLGVQGYGTDQALIALKKFISRFNAKMVVYTFLDGHIQRNVSSDSKPFFKLEGDRLVLKDASSPGEIAWSSRVIDCIRIFLDAKFGWFLRSKALTRRLIMEMKKVSEAHGAKFIVIHWMWNDKGNLKDIFKGMDLDVINTLDEAPPGWEKMVNPYDDHPVSEANAHVARLFLKYLLDERSRGGTSVFGVAGAAEKSR
jgi:hypothetical protein